MDTSLTEEDLNEFNRGLVIPRINQSPDVKDCLGIARDLMLGIIREVGVPISFGLHAVIPGGSSGLGRDELLSLEVAHELSKYFGSEGLHITAKFKFRTGKGCIMFKQVVAEKIREVEASLGRIFGGECTQQRDGECELRANIDRLSERFDKYRYRIVPAVMGENIVVCQAVQAWTRATDITWSGRMPIQEVHCGKC